MPTRTDLWDILIVHFLPSLGFLLALVLLSRILTERRSPASTMAWLLAVIFIPYVAVPMYIIIGGRKMKFLTNIKPMLPDDGPVTPAELAEAPETAEEKASIYDVYCPMLIPPRHHGVYPATRGNKVVLLPEGEQAFDECLNLIETARETIYCATFILGKDETGQAIVEALTRKAKQGLRVRLLLDAVGSMKIRGKFLAEFHKAGGKSAFFMPMVHLPLRGRANLRIHRKSLIADNSSAIMGGMNMAWEYMGPYRPGRDRWRDLSLRVEGPAASQLADIFRSDWRFASGEALPEPSLASPVTEAPGGLQLIASGPDVREDTLREAIITALFRAREKVWVVTPYFVPDQPLVEALCMAAHRDVDVRMIIPRRSNHRLADLARETYFNQLDEAGGTIMFYTPGMLHAKALVVDGDLAIVGSANMDMRSLLLNFEVALCMYEPGLVKQVDSWMGWLLAQCAYRPRKHGDRVPLLSGVGRLFGPLL